jgi:adenylate kinase
MIILFIGPPASGKGTISRLLSSQLDLPLVSTSKLLREIPPDSSWYKPVRDAMDKGLLAPNDLVGKILEEEISNSRYENGYILDGWIRQLSDLEHFNPHPDKVIYLDLDKETSKKRVLGRRICKKEGHIYNLTSHPPKKPGICDFDGSPLMTRHDDNAEVFKKRYQEFLSKTVPTIKFYQKAGKLIKIDAYGRPEQVFARVLSSLK